MKRKIVSMILIAVFALGCINPAFAISNETEFRNSYTDEEIENMAKKNDVDPQALKEAFEKGVDEEGRYSPFSYAPDLNSMSLAEKAEIDKMKLSSTGEPLIKELSENDIAERVKMGKARRGEVQRTNEHTTAYNWTGNKTASGDWPELGIVAVHREKDIYGGSSNAPVIDFGTIVYLDRYVWLPEGVDYISQFEVNDTGSGPGRSDYWLDIYYGHDKASADEYGVILLNYNYFE